MVKLLDTNGDGVVDALDADGDGSPDALSNPAGMAFDASGNLYIADRGNQRIPGESGSGRTKVLK